MFIISFHIYCSLSVLCFVFMIGLGSHLQMKFDDDLQDKDDNDSSQKL